MLKTHDIISICKSARRRFESSIQDIDYEPKGIFHSELLLVCSVVEHLGNKRIIESGVARAQSTLVIARYFRNWDMTIDSVELRKYTADSVVAKRRLAKYATVTLHYGNASTILPRLISRPCAVLIDGPKGLNAQLLMLQILKNPAVQAVFVHDVHRDSDSRDIMASLYPNSFFTDHPDFVEAFQDLDGPCWQSQSRHPAMADWAPYRRGQQVMQSYSATLGMVLNMDTGIDIRPERTGMLRAKIARKEKSVSVGRRVLAGLKTKGKDGLRLPYWFLRYHLGA